MLSCFSCEGGDVNGCCCVSAEANADGGMTMVAVWTAVLPVSGDGSGDECLARVAMAMLAMPHSEQIKN